MNFAVGDTPFFALGTAMLAIGASGQVAFVPIGIDFLVLGAVRHARAASARRSETETRIRSGGAGSNDPGRHGN